MSRNPIYLKLIHSKRWRDLRNRKIASQPVCEECEARELTTPATEVHHIEPVERGVTPIKMTSLMFNYHNLMSVCKPCHIALHRELNSFSKENIKKGNERDTQRFLDKFLKKTHPDL